MFPIKQLSMTNSIDDGSQENHIPKRPRFDTRPLHLPEPSRSNLRTFTDLLGAGTSRADSALGQSAPADAWSTLGDTVHNLPSVQALPDSAQSPANGSNSHFSQNLLPSAYSLRNLTHLPCDLSLKTRIKVISEVSLSWIRIRSPHDSFCALQAIVSNNDASIPQTKSKFSAQSAFKQHVDSDSECNRCPSNLRDARALFSRCLIHFRFPTWSSSSLLASNWHNIFSNVSKRMPRDDSTMNRLRSEAMERLSAWQNALQSIYFGFRYGHVPNFYILLSNSTVIFSRSLDDDQSPIVLLSPASPGLRSLLSDHIVSFTVCRAETDSTDQVCVTVKGEYDVHAFYNCIISSGHTLAGAKDVPTLICDCPFMGGTAMTAEIDFSREVQIQSSLQGAPKATRHSIHICGVLTPRQVEGICQALSHTQNCNFTAILETYMRSSGLNNMFVPDKTFLTSLAGHNILSQVAAFPGLKGMFAVVRQNG